MQGRNSKEHWAAIGEALTAAAKSFGSLMNEFARPTTRAPATAANTKTADIAAQTARAREHHRIVTDLFMAIWPAHHKCSAVSGIYGYQSPELVGNFIQMQSGLELRPGWNAKELAEHPAMVAHYEWLPRSAAAAVGDIAVYDGPGYGTVGVVVDLTPRHSHPMVYTQGPFPPRVVNLSHMSLIGYHRPKDWID